jgi:hypothetical protein
MAEVPGRWCVDDYFHGWICGINEGRESLSETILVKNPKLGYFIGVK